MTGEAAELHANMSLTPIQITSIVFYYNIIGIKNGAVY